MIHGLPGAWGTPPRLHPHSEGHSEELHGSFRFLPYFLPFFLPFCYFPFFFPSPNIEVVGRIQPLFGGGEKAETHSCSCFFSPQTRKARSTSVPCPAPPGCWRRSWSPCQITSISKTFQMGRCDPKGTDWPQMGLKSCIFDLCRTRSFICYTWVLLTAFQTQSQTQPAHSCFPLIQVGFSYLKGDHFLYS